MSQRITNAELRAATGISASYASMILNGKRPCPPAIALRAFRETGHRIGPLEDASEEEIHIFERLSGDSHSASSTSDGDQSPGIDADNSPSQESEAV